jgi:phage-related tail fiber protein
MATYKTIITDIGSSMIASALSANRRINLTSFKVGDGNGAFYTPTHAMTDVKNMKYSGTIESIQISSVDPSLIILSLKIPSTVGGFTIREIGIFSDNSLVSISNFPDTHKVLSMDGTLSELDIVYNIKVANTSVFNIMVNSNLTAVTIDQLNDHVSSQITAHNEDMNPHAGRFAGATHTHQASEISGLSEITGVSYTSLTNIPASFTPSSHSASHAAGGSDPITPESIGAAKVSQLSSFISVQRMELQDMENKATVFNEDGSIVETKDNYIFKTTFLPNGNIEVLVTDKATNAPHSKKTTVFLENGNINETIELL